MTDKETLRNIPSAARDIIIEKLQKEYKSAKWASEANALAYTIDHNEKDRAASLIAQGEMRAYEEILKLFKV